MRLRTPLPMAAYEYLVLAPIPEIDARPGDVLVWDYPAVALIRRTHARPRMSLIRMHPNHWWFVLSKYEDRLTPYDAESPPVAALPGIAVGDASPPPAGPPEQLAARHLRLLPN